MRLRVLQWATAVALAVLVGAVVLPPIGARQKIVIRLGHVGFPDSLYELTAQEFSKRVARELGDRVEVRVFHSSQLGTDEDMIRGVRVGALEMFLPSTIMSSVDDGFGVFEMPYIIVNRVHMKRVAGNADIRKALLDPQPVKGLRLLAFWENGFRHVTNNVRPIAKPEDLRGIKLRIPRGVWRQRMFQAKSHPDGVCGGVLRAADRGDGWPREPAGANLEREVPRGTEVPLHDRARLFAGIPDSRGTLVADVAAGRAHCASPHRRRDGRLLTRAGGAAGQLAGARHDPGQPQPEGE